MISDVGRRREPAQQRSRLRVDRILSAAADLVTELGPEATTTARIAESAGITLSSLYQFFPNKEAVFYELQLRFVAETPQLARDQFGSASFVSWREALRAIFDAYVDTYRSVPWLRVLWTSPGTSASSSAAALRSNAETADQILLLLLDLGLVAGPPTRDQRRALLLAVEMADAVINTAFRLDEKGDQAVLEQAASLLEAHLAPYADEVPVPVPSR